jgi:hypothetical protein
MLDIDDDDEAAAPEAIATTVDSATPPGPDGPTTIAIELECTLTDAEVQEHGEAMASNEREIDRLKTRRKSLNAQIRAKYDAMTELAQAIDSRREVRDITCTWRPDYTRKVWELQREDTKAIVRTRQMSSLDLQTRLPLESAGAADAAEDDDRDAEDAGIRVCTAADVDVIGEPYDADGGDDPDYVMEDVTSNPFGEDDDESFDPARAHLLPARSTPEARAAMARPAGTHPNGLTEAEHVARTTPTKPAKPRAVKPAAPAPAAPAKRAPKTRARILSAVSNTNGKTQSKRR